MTKFWCLMGVFHIILVIHGTTLFRTAPSGSLWVKGYKVIYLVFCMQRTMLQYFFDRESCCLVCFLRKLWVWEKIHLKFIKLCEMKTYHETMKKAVKLCNTRWNREIWEVCTIEILPFVSNCKQIRYECQILLTYGNGFSEIFDLHQHE